MAGWLIPSLFFDHKLIDLPAPSLEKQEVKRMIRGKKGIIILALLAAWGLIVPGIVAAVPEGYYSGPMATGSDFNLSGVDPVNSTLPAMYQATPQRVRIEVTVAETLIPGPKGEMQAGPRTIGFAADPVGLLILAVSILAGTAGFWYLAWRKPEEPEEISEEEEK